MCVSGGGCQGGAGAAAHLEARSRVSCAVGTHGAPARPARTPHRPKYKGKYCVGERRRLRLCNLHGCPAGRPSFRHVQCSHFDAMLYKGRLHTWVPVANDGESCHPPGHPAPQRCGLGAQGHP